MDRYFKLIDDWLTPLVKPSCMKAAHSHEERFSIFSQRRQSQKETEAHIQRMIQRLYINAAKEHSKHECSKTIIKLHPTTKTLKEVKGMIPVKGIYLNMWGEGEGKGKGKRAEWIMFKSQWPHKRWPLDFFSHAAELKMKIDSLHPGIRDIYISLADWGTCACKWKWTG